MSASPLRRLLTGLFAVWFVALGVTRGTYMACLDHRAEHLAAAAAAASLGTGTVASADAHAAHGGHGAHHAHAAHDGATAATTVAAVDQQASQPDAPQHCTCAGDCCCAVPAQAPPRAAIACAPEARVAPPLPEFAQTARPSDVVPYLLPFATAPPALTHLS